MIATTATIIVVEITITHLMPTEQMAMVHFLHLWKAVGSNLSIRNREGILRTKFASCTNSWRTEATRLDSGLVVRGGPFMTHKTYAS